MKKVLAYLRYCKKEAILAPLFKILEVFFELLVPLIVSRIIDHGVLEKDGNYILWMCLVLLAFAVIGFSSTLVSQYFSTKASNIMAMHLRNDLYHKVLSLSEKELEEIGTATLLTRLTNDVSIIQQGVFMSLRLLTRSPIVVFGAVIVAFFLSVKTGLFFLALVPLLLGVVFLFMFLTVPKYRKVQSDLDTTIRLSRENLNGVRVIRAFNSEEEEKKNYEKVNSSLKKSQLLVGRLSALTSPLTYIVINGFVILLLYSGAISVSTGSMSQGNVVASYNLISQILVEAVKFANLIMIISKAMASARRVALILEQENDLKKENDDSGFDIAAPLIEFRDVTMGYGGNGKPALSHVSFEIHEGETIGIIGGTGSGKSTLLSCLLHLYDIESGEILYRGKNILSVPDMNEYISIVPQKAELFRGTIRSNLLWGNPDAKEEELLEAVRISQSAETLSAKSEGLDAPVNQNGTNFSGGQKQRLSIARALLKKAPVLALDDAMSALDYVTDARLRKALREDVKGLTLLLVSQRTTSLQECDRILVLENGSLVGCGNHEELLSSCPLYKEIHESQFRKGDRK